MLRFGHRNILIPGSGFIIIDELERKILAIPSLGNNITSILEGE